MVGRAGVRHGQVLCPVIVGRESELDRIDKAIEAARAGRGGMLAFVGEPGIGKSRLARETEERADAHDMRTLRGRAPASAAPIPFRPLAEAIQAAFRRENPPDLGPGLRSVLAMGDAPAEHRSIVQYEAILRALHSIAGDAGLVLVLEDLHWADEDTLGVVDFLADNIGTERILCIVTLRDETGPTSDVFHAIAARRAAEIISLSRLSVEQSADMARRALAVNELSRELSDALRERAEGVPFVIEEMLTGYVASGELATLPHTYKELVHVRLATLDERARRLLYAAAVIGRRFEWSLLTAVTESPREEVLEDLRAAVYSKLVSAEPAGGFEMPFGFRHALVRDAILAEMLPPEIRELSVRAAVAIEDLFPGLPGEWCERVADLRETAGDFGAAARHLQEAAQRALVRGALASAESMLERARSLVANDRWHLLGIDRQLVEVLVQAGKVDRLREVAAVALEFVLEKRSMMPFITLGLGDLHLRLARGLAAAGEEAEADEHLARARDVASDVGEKRLLARVRAFEAVRALERGDVSQARIAAHEADLGATELDMQDVIAEALSVEGHAAFIDGNAESALQTLRRARDESGHAVVDRIRCLLDLGAVEAVVTDDTASLETARLLAAEAGAISSEARAQMLLGAAAVARFDLGPAAALLARCIETSERYGLRLLSDAKAVEAERIALAATEDEAIAASKKGGAPSFASVVLSLRVEDRDGARTMLGSLRGHPVARSLSCLLTAVDHEAFEQFPSAHALASGLLDCAEAVACSADGAAERYASADARLEPYPWWRHLARRLIAEAAFRDGWGKPERWTRECLAFFEDAGHERLVSACKALLRNAGAAVPRRGRGDAAVPAELRLRGVTSREMDVLRLVGLGLGNRDIAKRLFLSARTVETHVASLMRKLQAATRAELVAHVEP